MYNLIDHATRHLFFTGKGGVGKTSLACAAAIALADKGRRVLIVSTDPASNLDEALGVPLLPEPAPVSFVPGLFAMNLDPLTAAWNYRERMVAPYRGVLPEASVRSIEEQLSGACTVEIAAFDEFSRLLGSPAATAEFDHIIFDTAPTGHTLRLLQLPAAWNGFIDSNVGGSSCLGPLAGLQAQKNLYEATVNALTDHKQTTIVLVSRPERLALIEADRTRTELAALNVSNLYLVLNGLFISQDKQDSLACALESRQLKALAEIPPGLKSLPTIKVPLKPFNLIGHDALRSMLDPENTQSHVEIATTGSHPLPSSLASLMPEIASAKQGVIMTMGKGGVGKTTIAAAIAVELARLGYRVHLTTTDPAAHIEATVGEDIPNLSVSRINPTAEILAYSAEIMASAGKNLDDLGRALLAEDLRSPCTEEIAVFRAFARKVDEGKDGFVVLDTAPTGHTLLLLDATEAYHREVLRTTSEMPESVRHLLPRLQDENFTKVIIVTLAEATPVHEAAQLQGDLGRAGIKTFAWVINQSFSPLQPRDPVLLARRKNERHFIEEVQVNHAERVAIVPWMKNPPVGLAGLRMLMNDRNGYDAD